MSRFRWWVDLALGLGFWVSSDGERSDLEVAVSLISKQRIQILLSASVKLMTWSMKGLDLRAPLGTPNVCVRSS